MPQWGRALPSLALQSVSSGGKVSRKGKHENPTVFLPCSPHSGSAFTAATMGISEHPHPLQHLFVDLVSMNLFESNPRFINPAASCGSKGQVVTACWLETDLLLFCLLSCCLDQEIPSLDQEIRSLQFHLFGCCNFTSLHCLLTHVR